MTGGRVELESSAPGLGALIGDIFDDGGLNRVLILVDCNQPDNAACVRGESRSSSQFDFRIDLPSNLNDGLRHRLWAYAYDNDAAFPGMLLNDGNPLYWRWEPQGPPVLGAVSQTDLRYFGYFGVADQPPAHEQNTLDVLYHTNLIKVQEAPGFDLIDQLELARAAGQNVILDVTWKLFCRGEVLDGTCQCRAPDPGNPGATANWCARPNSTLWDAFAVTIGSYTDVIVALYLMDEPYHTSPDRCIADVKHEIEQAIGRIKHAFPAAAVATVFATPTFEANQSGRTPPCGEPTTFAIPAGYDWVGFDCYGRFVVDGSGRPVCGFPARPVIDYVDTLFERLTGTQKMILVPQGGILVTASGPQWQESDIVAWADYYYGLRNHPAYGPKIVGVMPFLWESRNYLPDGSWIGVKELPLARARYGEMGAEQILPAAPRTPWGDISNLDGSTLRGWALDHDTPTASIDVLLEFSNGVHVSLPTDVPRVDVNRVINVGGTHGFAFSVPPHFRAGTAPWVDVYGVDSTTGLLGPRIERFDLPALSCEAPGEAADLRLSHEDGVTMLRWSAPAVPGIAPISYDVLSSREPGEFVTNPPTRCVESDGADTLAVDAIAPGPGEVAFYLVRAESACGPGSLGDLSSGAPRAGTGCPTP